MRIRMAWACFCDSVVAAGTGAFFLVAAAGAVFAGCGCWEYACPAATNMLVSTEPHLAAKRRIEVPALMDVPLATIFRMGIPPG